LRAYAPATSPEHTCSDTRSALHAYHAPLAQSAQSTTKSALRCAGGGVAEPPPGPPHADPPQTEIRRRAAGLSYGNSLVVHAAKIVAGARINLDLGAGLKEQRNLDFVAGLNRGRLRATGGTVTLQTRLRVGNLKHHRSGKLNVQRVSLVHGDSSGLGLQHVVRGIPHHCGGHINLVVRLHVHEHVVLTILVQVLVVGTVHGSGLNLSASVKGAVNDLAGGNVAQLGADECATLTGLNVLELYDGPEVAVNLQDGAVLNIGSGCHGALLRVIDAHAVVVPGAALSFQ